MRHTLASLRPLPWGRLLLLAALAAFAVSRATPAPPAEAVDPPLYFVLDCDVTTFGVIEDDCTYHEGATGATVSLYAVNNTGTDLIPSSWTFTIRSNQSLFDPDSTDFFDPYFQFTNAGWTCDGPPAPDRDTNADPAIAESVVSCVDALNSASTPKLTGNGTPLLLLQFDYDIVPGTGVAPFTIEQGELTSREAVSMSCSDPGSLVPCLGATNHVIVPPPIDGPGAHYIVDCDAGAPGIQSVCGVPMGTPQAVVAVYVLENEATSWQLNAFDFLLRADQTKVKPVVRDQEHGFSDRNSNPDVNDALLAPGAWACSPVFPQADWNPDMAIADSLLTCFESIGTGPTFSEGTLRLIATVTYDVVGASPGFSDLTLAFGGIGDISGLPIIGCNTSSEPAHGTCHDARLYITGSLFDTDSDGRNDVIDNCIEVPNTAQQNSDRIFDLPASKAFDDATRANSDKYGDVCDFDDDNDGLHDTRELAGAPCASATAATDPLAMDTDGDRVADGAECLLGSDPANSSSLPAPAGTDGDNDGLPDSVEAVLESNPASTDSDGDSVSDGLEVRGWATSPASADSDGDGCADKLEIASVNGDQKVNSIDLSQVAQSFANAPDPGYIVEFDMNKDGKISSIDLSFVAQRFGDC